MRWLLVGLGIVALVVVAFIYMVSVMAWGDRRTTGLAYYGLPREGRARFKSTLRVHALLLLPFIRLLGKLTTLKLQNATFVEGGVPGPKGTCTPQSFARAFEYEARPEDVFVVTQMKCGTTWMQHVVYEVLHRGSGNLAETGTALYAVCPWLEAVKSVPVGEAPLLGRERPSRVIKTHLPAHACPRGDGARYVYVARHPVSCFASCVDFIATNAGAMAPPLDDVERWFTSSELMWWTPWPAHVAGWWERAERDPAVLFVTFEEMKRDLEAVTARVAAHLGVAPLTSEEMRAVAHKCGFAYMQEHKDLFEMHPPHLLQTDAELFVRGTADRHRDVPEAVRRRILRWCAVEMVGRGFPLDREYADVAAALS